MSRTGHRRLGYTLLEMLLATAITVLLMSALYVAMDTQLRLADAGRERVEQGTAARNILQRMSLDITGCLTPISVTKVVAAATSSTTGTTTTDDAAASSGSVTPFNAGVEGDSSVLTIYVSRVPPKASAFGGAEGQPTGTSDLKRISYWLAADGGLARQEFDRVTADDDSSALPPDIPDEQRYIVAPEVVDLSFRYFDGNAWTDSWFGSTLGADEATPIGPPRAVEITMTLRVPGSDAGDEKRKTFRHVVAIGAANAQPVMTAESTTTGTTSGTTTTGGTP